LFPFIGQLNEDEINNAFSQQHCAIAHAAHYSVELLDDVFGERLISRGIWPPRSTDLLPPAFFFWEAAKSKVHKNNPKSIAELKRAIQSYVKSIMAEMLHKVSDNKVRRVTACQEQGGKPF
jgi:hypothetical protein